MESLDKFYAGAIDGVVKNVNGKLLSSGKIMLGSIEGRELKVDFKEGAALIYMRCYLVRNKFYTTQTISLFEKENNESAKKFHGSFKVK